MVVATSLAVSVAACGAAGRGQPGEPVATQAGSTLTVRFTPSPDASTKVWTLTCQPPGGDHPAPEVACATLTERSNEGSPFDEPPKDRICTQIYGGPQKATIEGQWRGEPVSGTYSRRNGCEIKTWEALEPVIAPGVSSSSSPEASPTRS